MYCVKCGTLLSDQAGFCHECGNKVENPPVEPVCVIPEEQVVYAEPKKKFRVFKLIGTIFMAILVQILATITWDGFDNIKNLHNLGRVHWAIYAYIFLAVVLVAVVLLGFLLNKKLRCSLLVASGVLLVFIIATNVFARLTGTLGDSSLLLFAYNLGVIYAGNFGVNIMLSAVSCAMFIVDFVKTKKR